MFDGQVRRGRDAAGCVRGRPPLLQVCPSSLGCLKELLPKDLIVLMFLGSLSLLSSLPAPAHTRVVPPRLKASGGELPRCALGFIRSVHFPCRDRRCAVAGRKPGLPWARCSGRLPHTLLRGTETQGPGAGARRWLLRRGCGTWLSHTAPSCPKSSRSCCGKERGAVRCGAPRPLVPACCCFYRKALIRQSGSITPNSPAGNREEEALYGSKLPKAAGNDLIHTLSRAWPS